jgi:hypothetical protein
MVRPILCLLVLPLVFAVTVRAEIYEWQDGAGGRHFTNLIDEVPAAQRNDPKVVVRERNLSDASE